MLRQRVLVAVVGLPLLVLLIALPESAFAFIVIALLASATFEFVRAANLDAPRTVPVSAAAATALVLAIARSSDELQIEWLIGLTAITLALLLWRGSGLGDTLQGWWICAILYVGVAGGHFFLLRNLVDGRDWVIVLLAVTFAADTGAYTAGRLLGRHRIAPAISPNKTYEGAAGGLAAGAAAGIVVPLLLDISIERPGMLLIALFVPLAALAGDLIESAMKRRIAVKDMSNLLPGHGGLLDRLDSLLLAGPSLYWIVRWLQA